MKEQLKSRKFVTLIVMTIINCAYVAVCKVDTELMQLMPLVMMVNAVYGAYLGVNVWQKKISPESK